MSDNSLKWIPLGGMELSAANLAPVEKLRKFGFSLMFNEFGSEKLTKAGLCIYDVLAEKENPNILLITSNSELYGWYRILTTGIGADFKIVTGVAGAIVFFSKDCPNLFLMSSDALKMPNGLKEKIDADFVWDLIIIDEEQSFSVPDYNYYKEQLPWKTEKLVIAASFPAKKDEDKAAIADLVKSLLADAEQAAVADDIDLGIDSAALDYDSPVSRYFDKRVYKGEMKRNIEFREYAFDDSVASGLRRKTELRTGMPVYRYGGNVFEDYDSDEIKRTYMKPSYMRSDIEDLRAYDKKLDSFITLIDEILADEKNRAIVYCSDKNTLDYLRKVLAALYKGQGIVKTARGELFNYEDIIRKLRVDDSTKYPRIVLGVDNLGAVGDAFDRINYIINYELPDNAAKLERRYTRHGCANEADRKFIIFRDKNNMFDSQVLDKALYGGLLSGFCGETPVRNVLLDIDSKAQHLGVVIADLKYIADYASQVDNCFDLIKRVKCDYALWHGVEKISGAKQLAEFASKRLELICGALGINKDASEDEIAAAINGLSGLCYVTDGVINKVSDDKLSVLAASFDVDYKKQSFAREAVDGVVNAKKHIDELHAQENFHQLVKNELAALTDCIQYSVLFGIWRYRVREQDSKRSFRDYIKIYNDGI